jgi:hypothetical protein
LFNPFVAFFIRLIFSFVARHLSYLIKTLTMKKIILMVSVTFVLLSCGNHSSSDQPQSDSAAVNSANDSSTSLPGSGVPGTGATGTTGTGTVSDSGNAAHPGSDTMHSKMQNSPKLK